MASRLIEPYMTYNDANGVPLAGGLLHFYVSESVSTNKDTFSDNTLLTANANPIVLDAAGRAGVDVWGDGAYKVVVATSADVAIETYDPVTGSFAATALTNVAAMTALLKANLTTGDEVYISGYTTQADGGQGRFYWDSTSAATANGGTIFASDEGGTGRWLRIYEGNIFSAWFGSGPSIAAAANVTAIQAAIDALPQSVSGGFPTRYVNGGGTVIVGDGTHQINAAIKITHNVILKGQGKKATTLQTTGNTDCVQLEYVGTVLQEYTVINAAVRDITLDGAAVGESGITTRSGAVSHPISYCDFIDVDIVGFKTQFHIFGGWNNRFENIRMSATNNDTDTAEGMFGFIAETVTAGIVYGPAGHTVTAQAGAGGFNNNTFINCTCVYLKRCGFHVRAISLSHSYSNKFIGCNLEQIIKRTITPSYAPYTDLTATPEGLTVQTLAWDGRAVGYHLLGRIAGFEIDNNYLERISDQGVAIGGEGIIFDDLGLEFASTASKCYNNAVTNNFFNSNVERTVHFDRCTVCKADNNAILLSSGTDKGYLITTNASDILFERESLVNINSASINNYSWSTYDEGIGINTPVRDTAWVTVNTGTAPGIQTYRSGADANFIVWSMRNTDNTSDWVTMGYSSGQFRLDAVTESSFLVGGVEKFAIDGTAAATSTALQVWDVDNAALERVTVGAADSGGAGYKVLRIPN